MILLFHESLVLKHHRLPYHWRIIWQKKFWRYLSPYIATNLQVSIFCLSFLVTKSWPNLVMLEKSRKNGKTETAFEKKKICDAIVVSFDFFFFVSTKVGWSPSVNKTWMHSTAFSNRVRIPRLLGFFLQ